MNRRSTVRFGLGLVLLLLASSCAPVAQPPQPATKKEPVRLVVAIPADVSTLDVQNEPNTNLSQLQQIFDSLVRTDEKLEIQPALATSWKTIDNKTWEFNLRQGVKFHDGTPFTAKDVKWSYDRIMTAGAQSGPRKHYFGWLKSVDIVDDRTIRMTTEVPYPIVLRQIAFTPVIMSQAQFEKAGQAEFAKKPVGTGPFKVVNWKVNESLELEANQDYWGGPPAVDQLVFRIIPDESTRIAEMLTGGADLLIDVPLTRVGELKKSDKVSVSSKLGVLNFYIGINTHESPFDNLKVRQAIAYAVDVETMIKTVLGGYGHRANSIVHSTSFGWNPNLKPFDYDVTLSKKLIAEAGFPNGFKTTLEAGPGVWPATQEAAEALSGYLGAVGIQTDVKISEFGDFFEKYRGTKLKGLHLWGNVSPNLDADSHINLNFHCPPSGRGLYWCSKETDDLIDKSRSELDVQARKNLLWNFQEIVQSQMGAIPLWQYDQVAATNTRFKWEPRGDFFMHATDVRPAK